MNLNELLKETVEKKASDLHISVGIPPYFRIDGKLVPAELPVLSFETCKELCYSILNEEQKNKFEKFKELDFSYGVSGVSRFRINFYWQRGSIAAAFRPIPFHIPGFEELGLPLDVMKKFASLPRGFVLITGPTGSGKSTTLASLINYINEIKPCHIISIEDPIEYLFKHKKSIIHQREIEEDTISFTESLRHVLREDPDIVFIGEMRDMETVRASLNIAETGHLVFSTLHTGEAVEVINRIIDIFPPDQQQQIRIQLSLTLSGVVWQQLLPKTIGKGRILGTEVMIVTPAIRNLIRENKPHEIYSHILLGKKHGMNTMNQSLLQLYNKKEITFETALERSPKPDELLKLIKES